MMDNHPTEGPTDDLGELVDEVMGDEEAVPVCLNCLEPVDPLDHVCPHCSAAVGQYTPNLPYESIRWSVDIWARMWDQVWRRETVMTGRVLRVLVIFWFLPIYLVVLLVGWLCRVIRPGSSREVLSDEEGQSA